MPNSMAKSLNPINKSQNRSYIPEETNIPQPGIGMRANGDEEIREPTREQSPKQAS